MDQLAPKSKTFQDSLYEKAARNQSLVKALFDISYSILISIVVLTTISAFRDQEVFNYFLVKRAIFGRLALVVLLITLTPGILGRFNIQIKAIRIITLFRRRLGILVFLLAFTHASLMFLPKIVKIEPFLIPPPTFQIFGILALTILSFMFLTSNNFSVRRLGPWWKRLHRLVYVALLFILLHTALQRTSIWSISAGVFFALEISSLIYAYLKGGSFNNPTLKQTPKTP
ncbi:MAG: ferric reductase-like transmembrane domain-containing protein [Candidatus Woykebacteria bacterium]